MPLPLGERRRAVFACAAAFVLAGCATQRLDEAEGPLRRIEQAMGGTQLKTLRYAGNGSGATFGQAFQPGMAWPRLTYSSFSRTLDYENAALREDFARSRAEPTGGGAVPLMGSGEQRVTGLLAGGYAWNMAGPAPVPAPVALDARIHDLWTTPHGFVKAALRNKATLRTEGDKTLVSFTEPGRLTATGWIGADNLVERIDSVQPNAVLGDTPTVTLFSDYREFAGVKFPTRIRQTQGGFPVLDLQVDEVQPNAPAEIALPALVAQATEQIAVERAAPGVWFLAGGSHNSVAIEMSDHLIVVESPLFDGRALPMLAEARRLAPGKPVRYVINTHHHFDHAGGLRAAASEGATLVTSELARPWYERVLNNPNALRPDALRRSGRLASVLGVNGQRSFADELRTVEIFMIEESVHSQGFMLVYLPRERLLIQADAFTPGPPNAQPPVQPNANHVNLLQNMERLKLNVERILPLHGRMVPVAELYTAVGRRP